MLPSTLDILPSTLDFVPSTLDPRPSTKTQTPNGGTLAKNGSGNEPQGGISTTRRESNQNCGGKVTKIAMGYHQVYLSLSPSL